MDKWAIDIILITRCSALHAAVSPKTSAITRSPPEECRLQFYESLNSRLLEKVWWWVFNCSADQTAIVCDSILIKSKVKQCVWPLSSLQSQLKSWICFCLRGWRESTLWTNLSPESLPSVPGQPPTRRTALPWGDGQQRSHIHHPLKIKRTMLVNVPLSWDNELELDSAFPLFKDFIHRLS